MSIFVVIDGKDRSYVQAENLKQAKKGRSKRAEVRPWKACFGRRHDKIPGTSSGLEGLDAEHLIDGIPICGRCFRQLTMTVEQRLDRLESLVTKLRSELDAHEKEEWND